MLKAVPFKYTWEGVGGTPFISDPPPNINKYGFTPTTNKKKFKNGVPPSQVDLNGTALSWFVYFVGFNQSTIWLYVKLICLCCRFYPDYYDEIDRPMSLSNVRKKIKVN